ncbi:MAG TPA: c-type cytochrome [Methylomirabilota bacterium]|nr:c-type cytochrome [Methylomirabilota bacterium]
MTRRWTFYIALGLWLGVLSGLKLLVRPPIPASVLTIYMSIATLGILLFVAADEARLRYFLAPLRAVFEGRAPRAVQAVVFLAVALGVAGSAWWRVGPSSDAPFEPRVIHPEPPASFSFRGTRAEIAGLQNPLRTHGAALPTHIAEGKTIYYQNCFFCHGDALAGDGHFAGAFAPIPANFRDVGTISMLQESFVFWRVATGGPGLPRAATPWNSAMPAWQHFLSAEDIWKVILHIYAGSGSTPRTWGEDVKHDTH